LCFFACSSIHCVRPASRQARLRRSAPHFSHVRFSCAGVTRSLSRSSLEAHFRQLGHAKNCFCSSSGFCRVFQFHNHFSIAASICNFWLVRIGQTQKLAAQAPQKNKTRHHYWCHPGSTTGAIRLAPLLVPLAVSLCRNPGTTTGAISRGALHLVLLCRRRVSP